MRIKKLLQLYFRPHELGPDPKWRAWWKAHEEKAIIGAFGATIIVTLIIEMVEAVLG